MAKKKLLGEKSKMTLEKLGRLTQQGFLEVDKRFGEVDKRFGEVDKKISALDTKIEVKSEKLDNRLAKVEFELREIKRNSSELFTKLDKFISLYERQEQELLVLGAQLRRLEERVAVLEKSR